MVIALSWFLIGLAMDRKRLGRDLARAHRVLALWLFWAGAVFFGLMAVWRLGAGGQHLWWAWRYQYLRLMHSEYTMWAAAGLWSLGLFVYFVRRLWRMRVRPVVSC